MSVQEMQQKLIDIKRRQYRITLDTGRRAGRFSSGQRTEVAASNPRNTERQEWPQQAGKA